MKIEPKDISKLDEILKPCVVLTSLSLKLFTAERNDLFRQKLANDLSLLIGHHPTLKRLVLRNFLDLLVGYGNKYPLPTSLETLVLHDSVLTRWTDATTTSHIRDFTISNDSFCSIRPSDVEGCLKFVESHAETLVSLHINLSSGEHQPTVDRLKRMAKRLAQFNKLQRFTYYPDNDNDLLEILHDVMSLINQSLNSYTLSDSSFLGDDRRDRDFIQSVQMAMKTICRQRRRLLDFALLTFDGHDGFNGITIVDYEDMCEVVDNQWHSLGDYGCERDDDEDLEDGIPINGEHEDVCEVVSYECQLPCNYDGKQDMDEDFQDGIPIGEYEDKCEVVGYHRQLPDDYDCEHDMDDIAIGEYEEVCEVVSYQCHLPDDYVDEDFQNGIPIMEYEDVCEVVDYRTDNYACNMDEDVDCDQ